MEVVKILIQLFNKLLDVTKFANLRRRSNVTSMQLILLRYHRVYQVPFSLNPLKIQ